MNAVLPELKTGDVIVRDCSDGTVSRFTVVRVGRGSDFDEPVYFLKGLYGLVMKRAYTGEELDRNGYRLENKSREDGGAR